MKDTSDVSEIPLKSPETALPEPEYRFAGYDLDCQRWQLRWGGEPLTIHRKSFDLLLCLVRAHGRVVSKDELMETVWPGQFVEENNLAQQISSLRKTLTRHADAARMIETVPGRGYRLVPPVEGIEPAPPSPLLASQHILLNAEESITRITVHEETEEDVPDATETDQRNLNGAGLKAFPVLPTPAARRRRGWWAAVAVATVAVMAAAGWFGWHWWQDRNAGPPLQVVLTPMEGTTGDTTLDHALNNELRFDLAESPFVTLVSAAQVNTTLHQMRRPPDEALSPATASEVCERTSSQAVVHAVLARTGQHFLLTGEAVSCVSGKTLASTERDAAHAEDLPGALGELTARLRRQLGETRGSVARFSMPGYTAETSSLDALKALYQGYIAGNAGRSAEALESIKKAVALDPKFALAYFDLSVVQSNLNDTENARENIQRAFDLRSSVDPQTQMLITSRYDTVGTGDLYAARRNDALWTEAYPRSAYAWDQFSQVLEQLGEHSAAVAAEQKAVALRPEVALCWSALAQAQLHTGDLVAARHTSEHGLTVSPDAEDLRMTLAKLALHVQDPALSGAELAWVTTHPDTPHLHMLEAELAVTTGRFHEAEQFTDWAVLAYNHQGSAAGGIRARKYNAMELLAAGDRTDGERLFHVTPLDPEEPSDLMSLALLGEAHHADMLLTRELQLHPDSTEWHAIDGPLIRGMAALAQARPQDALAALNAQGVLDGVDAQIDYLRGSAYLQLHDDTNAAAQFHRAVEHPGFDSSYAYSLSWLGLARAEAAQGRRNEAAGAYRKFLALTAKADADAAVVVAARREFDALNGPGK